MRKVSQQAASREPKKKALIAHQWVLHSESLAGIEKLRLPGLAAHAMLVSSNAVISQTINSSRQNESTDTNQPAVGKKEQSMMRRNPGSALSAAKEPFLPASTQGYL